MNMPRVKVMFAAQIPAAMLDALDAEADRLDISRSELARRYIAAGLEQAGYSNVQPT